jgi:hypothetical protein
MPRTCTAKHSKAQAQQSSTAEQSTGTIVNHLGIMAHSHGIQHRCSDTFTPDDADTRMPFEVVPKKSKATQVHCKFEAPAHR